MSPSLRFSDAPDRAPDNIVNNLRAPLERAAADCVRRALEQSDDALFDRAQRDETVGVQDCCFAAMRELRRHRQAILDRFEAALDESFGRGFARRRPEDHETAAGQWALLGRDEIEEEVAADGAVSRLRHRHARTLAEMENRLRQVVSLDGSGDDNPFDPAAVVRSFTRVLGDLEMAIQPRIIVYKLFEEQLLAAVGEVYRSLNAELADAGLSVNLAQMASNSDPVGQHPSRSESATPARSMDEVSAPESDLAAHSAGDSAASAGPAGTAAAANGAAAGVMPYRLPPEEEVLGVLHQLVAAARADSGRYPPDDSGASGETVAGALSAIQRSAGQHHSEPLDPAYLKGVLRNGLQRRTGMDRLERSADETIDIVSMLFEVILEDERLPGAIEAQFARLQVPVLKVAMTDPEFLANSAHPARRLFNTLARAALGLGGKADVSDDVVYQNIRAAIERVVEEYRDDPGVFQSVLNAFEAWQWQIGRGAIDHGADQAEGASRQARVDAVRAQVTGAVEARVGWSDPDRPEVVERLLREAWFKVLFITGIKHGVDSALWVEQTGLMDELLRALQRHDDASERDATRNALPSLLQGVQDGLNGVMYNPAGISRLVDDLQRAFAELNPESQNPAQGNGHEPPDHASPQGPADVAANNEVVATFERGDATTSAPSGSESAVAPSADDDVKRKMASIPICSWFEFTDDSGERTRACLQARVEGGQRYIFADRHGRRVAEYSVRELVAAMEAGTATAVEDTALFDRAIESVIGRLRQQAGAGGAAN